MAMALRRGLRAVAPSLAVAPTPITTTPIEYVFALTAPRFAENGQRAQSDAAVPPSAMILCTGACVQHESVRFWRPHGFGLEDGRRFFSNRSPTLGQASSY